MKAIVNFEYAQLGGEYDINSTAGINGNYGDFLKTTGKFGCLLWFGRLDRL